MPESDWLKRGHLIISHSKKFRQLWASCHRQVQASPTVILIMSVMFLLIAARWLPPCHIRPNGKNGQRLALGYHLSLSLFPFFLTKTGMHAYLLTNFYKYEQRSPISYANQNLSLGSSQTGTWTKLRFFILRRKGYCPRLYSQQWFHIGLHVCLSDKI